MRLNIDQVSGELGTGEVVMMGVTSGHRIVARLAMSDLPGCLDGAGHVSERAYDYVISHLAAIERAATRKYQRNEYHLDLKAGETVVCVHVEVSDIERESGAA